MRDKTKRMLRKNEKKNTFVAENTAGYIFIVIAAVLEEVYNKGEMLEWLKRHAWKACIPLKGIGGSNPPLSATDDKKRIINKHNNK